jgi:hypothetical protein
MIAACGDANDPTPAAVPPNTPGGRLATIGVENSGLGKILLDSRGRTVYLFLPLYLFAGDQNPGDTNGQGLTAFGAKRYVLSPAGNQNTQQPSSSGGNGGY